MISIYRFRKSVFCSHDILLLFMFIYILIIKFMYITSVPKYDCLSELHSVLHIFADKFSWCLNFSPSNTLIQPSTKQPTYSYSKTTTQTIWLEHWTSLSRPLFIEVPSPGQENEWYCMCVMGVSIFHLLLIWFSYLILELFWQFCILQFYDLYHIHSSLLTSTQLNLTFIWFQMNFILTHENATGKIVLESSVKGIPGIEIYILLQHKITY